MAALREDLRRHLAHEPILARAPGTLERSSKWTRRHPTAATALALLSLSFVVLALLLARSQRDRRIADTEAQISQETVDFLVGLFEAGGTERYGLEEPTLRELIERGAQRLANGSITEPGARARLLMTLGGLFGQLGEWDRARAMLVEAAELQERASGFVQPQLTRHLAESYFDAGDSAAALELLRPLYARCMAGELDSIESFETMAQYGLIELKAGDFVPCRRHGGRPSNCPGTAGHRAGCRRRS